jgi:hypothetical protein
MLLVKLIHINMDKIKRPKLYTLPDALHALQHPPPVRSARRGLPCIWYGLRCCLYRVAVPGALEWAGVHRRGIQGTPGVGVGR